MINESIVEKKEKSLLEKLKEKIEKSSKEKSLGKEKISKKDLATKSRLKSEKSIEIDAEKKYRKKGIEKKGQKKTLIPLEDYIKCAVHLGTKVITPGMRKYVYKRRADGLAVINTNIIDDKLREAITFLNKYEAKDIYMVCRRDTGLDAAKKFEQATNIRTFTKRYLPGITTNLLLDEFFEAKLTIICDPWVDKNALRDSIKLKKPILGLCCTNNYIKDIPQLIPCNNKSKKSIGCILYILAREYCTNKKIPFDYKLEDFTGSLE